MPFLAEKGYDTYSISLRGTSGTPIPDQDVRHDNARDFLQRVSGSSILCRF